MSKIDVANRKLSSLKLQSVVLEELGSKNLFDLQGHFLATAVGIENRYFDLVRKLVDIFFTVRQYHIVRLHNMKKRATTLRQKLTKSILIMGQ